MNVNWDIVQNIAVKAKKDKKERLIIDSIQL